MTSGQPDRRLAQGIVLKIGFPLMIALLTLVAAHFGGMQVGNSLVLAAVVAFAAAFAAFIVDTESRLSAIDERAASGLAQVGQLAELFASIERSSLGPALLTDFLATAGQVDGEVNPLLRRLAGREIERVTAFMRQLPVGIDIGYDGEDRDWMLGLTQEANASIDAISLSTVDAGVIGLDGGLWTSDLGQRYLEFQREAVMRGVRVRRIFVVEEEHTELIRDESYLRITKVQRDIGVQVRTLDHQLIPDWMRAMVFDFIVFDGAVSYETTPTTTFSSGQLSSGQPRPGMLRTRLALQSKRVHELQERFEALWQRADPERELDE
jgi:hypothetical protein